MDFVLNFDILFSEIIRKLTVGDLQAHRMLIENVLAVEVKGAGKGGAVLFICENKSVPLFFRLLNRVSVGFPNFYFLMRRCVKAEAIMLLFIVPAYAHAEITA